MNKSTPAVYGSSPPGEPPQQAGQPLVIEPINNTISIHSIHPEILACIFEFFVYDPDQAGWTLCSVCRLWWRIALSTPTLWNKIAINPENALNYNPYAYRWDVPGLDQPQYSSNGYQLCFTMGHLQAALRLTGSVGLYINFNYIFLKEEDIRRGLDMLNLVLGSPYAHKLVQLDLTFCGRTPSFTVDSYHEEAWAWSFPKLRFLRLCVDPSPFHNALLQRFSMAPGIEDVDIINTAFFGSLGLSPSLLSKWNLLRRLYVPCVSGKEINYILPSITHLSSLEGAPHKWPDAQTPSVIFPNLEELRLSCDPACLSALSLPRVWRLSIEDVNEVGDGHGDRRLGRTATMEPPPQRPKRTAHLFPSVKELQVDTRDPQWLADFEFPVLHTFSLRNWHHSTADERPGNSHNNDSSNVHSDRENSDDSSPVNCDLVPLSHPQFLKTFTLLGGWPESQLGGSLSKVPNLETLVLKPHKSYRITELYRLLIEGGTATAAATTTAPKCAATTTTTTTAPYVGFPVLCPRLKEVHLSTSRQLGPPSVEDQWWVDQLEKIKEMRQRMGYPLSIHVKK